MTIAIDLEKLPPPARKALSPDAPGALRNMAAKGVLPGLKPGDIVTVVAALSASDDVAIAELAGTTLGNLAPPILNGALQADLEAPVIELLAGLYSSNHDVVEKLLRLPRIGGGALELLADAADERAGELIATNEQLMLEYPRTIEKLYMNKRVRLSTADRLLELAVRNGLELDIPAFKQAATAIKNELIAEPSEEPTYDDVLFKEVEDLAERTELEDDTHELDEEGKEVVKPPVIPLYQKVANMTISGRIRAAQIGDKATRMLLIRDPNRLVATAAAKSPKMKESEAIIIAQSRAVSEDVLREIALNREFTRNYQVKLNLISNPRTPFTFASRMIPHLRDTDLKSLAKSKNVPSAISQAVSQQIARKSGKRRG
jgi:hypothetical protein